MIRFERGDERFWEVQSVTKQKAGFRDDQHIRLAGKLRIEKNFVLKALM